MISIKTNLLEQFKTNTAYVLSFFDSVPVEKLQTAYAQAKWTIKEVFQHLIDTERVFQFRCFCIARGDKTSLPAFNENDYVPASKANSKDIESLIEEFVAVRESFMVLLNSLTNEDLQLVGNVNNKNQSASATAFFVLEHYLWHINIIKERYL